MEYSPFKAPVGTMSTNQDFNLDRDLENVASM